jgi:dihydrofolate reductase
LKLILIASVSPNRVIGRKGQIPWYIPRDLAHFKETTTHHYVLMGRKTFESLGKVLPHRVNIVITKANICGLKEEANLKFVNDITEAVQFARSAGVKKLFVIGGGEIYRQVIDLADELIISELKSNYEGDVYFPKIDDNKWVIQNEETFDDFNIVKYIRSG